MKLTKDRINMTGNEPPEVLQALYTIGHYLANTAPDMEADFNVTEGDEVIRYVLEVKEVKRQKWLIEGEAF